MNMFKPVKARDVAEYIASTPEDRQETLTFLHEFIQKSAPGLKPHFAYNMLGYGSFPYRNYKKEMAEWPIIALANQKNYISLYVSCTTRDGEYLAEKNKDRLGKVNVGKSCIRFKKLEDINLGVLKEVIQSAAKDPGMVSTEKQRSGKVGSK